MYQKSCSSEDGEDVESVSLELRALMLNINKGHNETLKEACKTLKDYAEYTDRVRKYSKEMALEEAVERAITECIREGILKEFLRKNRAEAKRMSIYEYDQEKHLRQEREASWEKGKEEGMKLLNDLYSFLAKEGRTNDILRAVQDSEYRDKMLRDFLEE